ncbi:hypothetical protein QQ045_010953 [Rhodiola kirilowii]
MGKACKSLKASSKNKGAKSSYTRYLKPVAVQEYGGVKVLMPDSCTETGLKRGDVLDFKVSKDHIMVQKMENDQLPALCSPLRCLNVLPSLNEFTKTPKTPCKTHANNLMRSPKTPCTLGRSSSRTPSVLANLARTPKTPNAKSRFQSWPSTHGNLMKTPKTPCSQETLCESRLESLPFDILVKVLCHLHHDQLKPVFHVSKRVREAVLHARQFHFNFTTPDRSRQALLNTTTLQHWEHWPFVKNRSSMLVKPCPKTPKARRHIYRPPPKFDSTEVCRIDDAIFQESAFPSRCASSSSLTTSISKTQLASNRVLFYHDECCNSWL